VKNRVGLLLFALFTVPLLAQTDILRPQTLAAWDEYIGTANVRLEHDVRQKNSFFLIDHDPGLRARLRGGAIVISPVGNNGHTAVPHGIITDWVGDVFVPNATIGDVVAQLNDYDRYRQFFNPTVVDARLLSHTGAGYSFSMVLRQKVLFVTPVLEGDYESQTTELDGYRWYTVSRTTRLQDVENYGEPNQRKLPPDQGHGYIWRIYNITRFEERDGGVYIEIEALALSRDVPAGLRWLIDPVVRQLPRNSLAATLQQTRDAVTRPSGVPGMLAQSGSAEGSK
jgi:hypothetical protein